MPTIDPLHICRYRAGLNGCEVCGEIPMWVLRERLARWRATHADD